MILEDKIEIDAPGSRVWQVSTNVEAWPQWTPAMERVQREDSGEFKLGSTALIKQKGLPETRWTVTDLKPGHHFSWKARVLGMDMAATHVITSGERTTTNLLRLEISGWVARLLMPVIKPLVGKSLKEENRGLKKYCESGF